MLTHICNNHNSQLIYTRNKSLLVTTIRRHRNAALKQAQTHIWNPWKWSIICGPNYDSKRAGSDASPWVIVLWCVVLDGRTAIGPGSPRKRCWAKQTVLGVFLCLIHVVKINRDRKFETRARFSVYVVVGFICKSIYYWAAGTYTALNVESMFRPALWWQAALGDGRTI